MYNLATSLLASLATLQNGCLITDVRPDMTNSMSGMWMSGIAESSSPYGKDFCPQHALHGTLPNAVTMGFVGMAALVANAVSFGLLWAYRSGDANMRSAWICTRNDVLGNLAVLLAALGVFGTGTGWPDVIVAAAMAGLAVQGAVRMIRQSLRELNQPALA